MDAKTNFGVDYLNMMALANTTSGGDFNWNAYRLSRLMLCWEWGFTSKEQDEANSKFNDMIEKNLLEDFAPVAGRIVTHLQNNEEAKRRFITDMMMINLMDGNVSEEEKNFTLSFAEDLDFRKSEILQMAERANDLVIALDWYTENYKK